MVVYAYVVHLVTMPWVTGAVINGFVEEWLRSALSFRQPAQSKWEITDWFRVLAAILVTHGYYSCLGLILVVTLVEMEE